MLVCHCKRINDKRIRQLVEAGARTVGQVASACGAGTGCGSCVPTIAEVVAASRPLPITTFNTDSVAIAQASDPRGGYRHRPSAPSAGSDFLAAE